MTQEEALNHPDVNVFDIIDKSRGKYQVITYPKKGESEEDYIKRHLRNVEKANQLKRKSQA
jgi:hypothetical protein